LCRKVIEAIDKQDMNITIWGDGTPTRSFMYIDDCVKGIDMITHCDELIATPINLGSSELVSINELLSKVEKIAGVKLKRHYDLDAPRGVAGRNSDNTFIQKMLKWEPKTPLNKAFGRHLQVDPGAIPQPEKRQTRGGMKKPPLVTEVIGAIPNRLQLAGGWIDQPFVSRLNPRPPGSMVVVALEPTFRVMDRSGCASGTRAVATKLWKGRLPNRPPEELVRELYEAENKGKTKPSGSQDMIGLIYPGINRLDYDFAANGGVFPSHIEITEPRTAGALARKGPASAAG
jgi:hypothetical protein